MLVVDANIVIDCCLSGEGFESLSGHELVVPLLRPEALSVMHEMFWRQTAPRELMGQALARLETAPAPRPAPEKPTGRTARRRSPDSGKVKIDPCAAQPTGHGTSALRPATGCASQASRNITRRYAAPR